MSRSSRLNFQRLERVLALKSLGLTLDDIKRVLSGEQLPVSAHREKLEEERDRLDCAINALRGIEGNIGQSQRVTEFIRQAAWDRVEALRQTRATATPRPPDRAAQSRIALFHQLEEAVQTDPAGPRARELARQWRETIEPETLEAFRNRSCWPSGMRRYVASLYEASPESLERVASFIETGD